MTIPTHAHNILAWIEYVIQYMNISSFNIKGRKSCLLQKVFSNTHQLSEQILKEITTVNII